MKTIIENLAQKRFFTVCNWNLTHPVDIIISVADNNVALKCGISHGICVACLKKFLVDKKNVRKSKDENS